MRKLIAVILFIPLLSTANNLPQGDETEVLIQKLDSALANKSKYIDNKEEKIKTIREKKQGLKNKEEIYFLNKMLYEEYSCFNLDSALIYANMNLSIAKKYKRKDWCTEWKIKKSFLLTATGLLKEALDIINDVSASQLSRKLKIEYYNQMIYLYSHLNQYLNSTSKISSTYYKNNILYQDSLNNIVTPKDAEYLWIKGWHNLDSNSDKREEIKKELLNHLSHSALNTRWDAMYAYILAHLFKAEKLHNEYTKYMLLSAIIDVKTANRDIASLEELADLMYKKGDINRAYNYINYCLQAALLYPNRVRVVSIAAVQDKIHQAYQQKSQKQESRLHLFLIIVSILSAILIIALLFIYKQMRKLMHSRVKLDESNKLLKEHVDELSEAHMKLRDTYIEVSHLNEQLQSKNNELLESNYVKEEYIGYVFTIYSNYITQLDNYRKSVNRKIKANQFEELKKSTNHPTIIQKEIKEFYHNFDAIFLHIYPHFVSDFNELLKADEQIVLKEGELLNTELRIYALVRLGINDSVKIAKFLHCSTQTVYNNRLKTRNKSLIPKDEFAEKVRYLGKVKKP